MEHIPGQCQASLPKPTMIMIFLRRWTHESIKDSTSSFMVSGVFMTTTGSTLMGGDALGGTVSYLEARTWNQRYCLAVDKLKHLE